jgi:Tol biopolymer transport system component
MRRLVLTLLLGAAACAPASTVPPQAAPQQGSALASAMPRLATSATSDEIREAMLASSTRWDTLEMEGTVRWLDPTGAQPAQVYYEQVRLEPARARFRVILSAVNSEAPETARVSDGRTILEVNLITGQSASRPLPAFAKDTTPARPHPLWGQIGTPLSEMALAANYASDQGTFQPLGVESVAGREALVVEWILEGGSHPQWRLWLDTETAVILRLQEFGKGGGEELLGERLANSVIYDQVFDAAAFGIPASIPTFAATGPASEPADSGTPVVPLPGANGEVYFFTLPQQAGTAISLVRLPGECVMGAVACPPLESVPAPFPFNFSLEPLAWSKDGRLAAFAYPDDSDGTPTKLFLFDPGAGTWRAIAEFPYIDPPFWAPDGTWLAFRVQDGLGGEGIYAIRRDGTGLINVTASGALPVDGRPYVMDGWLTENVIVRSALPGTEGGVYLVRASDGAVRPLFQTLLTKAAFVVSPDNAWLAFDEYDYAGQKHALKVVEPDAGNPTEIAAFAGGSVYPIVWSPDSARLAFAHSTTDADFSPISNVYVVGRDGRGTLLAYQGSTVGRLLFSPDGAHLLVEETSSPTGGHLFVVDLQTLTQRILAAPGLALDTNWYAPSWRP